MRRLAVACLLATGCTEPVVGLAFQWPTRDDTPDGYDISCVSSVELLVLGAQPDGSEDQAVCIDLPRVPKTFTEIESMLRGQIDLPLPESGLAALSLKGFAGPCAKLNPDAESVFYGGTPASGTESLTVPVRTNVSCNGGITHRVRAIDLLELARTGTCTPSMGYLYAGTIRPLMLGPSFPDMTFEYGASGVDTTTGTATLETYRAAGANACVSVALEKFSDPDTAGGGCINPTAPTLCAQPGELEIGTIPLAVAANSVDPMLNEEFGAPVFAAVFSKSADPAAPRMPLAGATVQIGVDAGAVVYVSPDANFARLLENSGAATDASGFFIAYLPGTPTQITVSAPGHRSQTYTVATAYGVPITLAIGLEPTGP